MSASANRILSRLPIALAFLLAACTAGRAGAADQAPLYSANSGAPACAAGLKVRLTGRDDFAAYARCKAEQYGMPGHVAVTVMEIESGFEPSARGQDGEVGLMQVMPPTATMLGFRGTIDDLADPGTNIDLGVGYLAGAWRLAGGDLCTTVMKYRAGHGETRFSVRSVDYCRRARAIFERDGIAVTGDLPEATFGFGAASGGAGACLRRSFVPGPGYGRCLQRSDSLSHQNLVKQRRALFGG